MVHSHGDASAGLRARGPLLGRLWHRLAARLPADPPPPDAGPRPADGADAGLLCVLVADDNPVNLLLAAELLLFWGIQPSLAADGAEAVALAGALRLDLILMDLQMPVLDGLAATRQIRRHELASARARVPVLAYTTSSPSQALLESHGLDGSLDKPCDAHALQACLQRWCTSKAGAAAVARLEAHTRSGAGA